VRDQLDYGFVARFVPVADAAHDDTRAMAAEAADFMTFRWLRDHTRIVL
jgi:hypothetical protein